MSLKTLIFLRVWSKTPRKVMKFIQITHFLIAHNFAVSKHVVSKIN